MIHRVIVSLFASIVISGAAAEAQIGETFRGIPWDASLREVQIALETQGWTLLETDHDSGSYLFSPPSDDHFAGFVRVRMDSVGPVSIGTLMSLNDFTDQQVQSSINEAVLQFSEQRGEPDQRNSHAATWLRENDTQFSIYIDTITIAGLTLMNFETRGPRYSRYLDSRPGPKGPRWRTVWDTEDSHVSLDTRRLHQVSEGLFIAWMREDYVMVQKEPVHHDQSLYQMEFDCERMQFRVITLALRYRGEVVYDHSDGASKWGEALPESRAEWVLRELCR